MRANFQTIRRSRNLPAALAIVLLPLTQQMAAASEAGIPQGVAQPPSFLHHLLVSNGIIFGPLMLLLALALVGLIAYLALSLRRKVSAQEPALNRAAAWRWEPQERALRWLGGIGLLSPLVGLLGTVLGVMLLCMAVSRSGAAVSDLVLITGLSHGLSVLFEGLLLACIALPAYVLFKNRLQRLRLTGEQA